MNKIILIRHGETYGNTLKRYIGTTDEELLETTIAALKEKEYPYADIVYSSPMRRCKQTAKILYENKPSIIVEDFKECNFGEFENKNYKELSSNLDYQKWMVDQVIKEFPNGEKLEDYNNRTIKALEELLEIHKNKNITIAIIAHGGTIMNIMKYLSLEESNLYDWQVENGCGYEIMLGRNNEIRNIEEI